MKRLITIIAQDTGKGIRLVYVFDEKGKVVTREMTVGYKEKAKSLYKQYPSAEYYEREIHDFFGIYFDGCPNIDQRLFKAEKDTTVPFREEGRND